MLNARSASLNETFIFVKYLCGKMNKVIRINSPDLKS